jgi:hypothetical protein
MMVKLPAGAEIINGANTMGIHTGHTYTLVLLRRAMKIAVCSEYRYLRESQ